MYMMKRRASVSGDGLEIICMPDELEKNHLPELNKIIAETNAAYQSYVFAQTRQEQIEAEDAPTPKGTTGQAEGALEI